MPTFDETLRMANHQPMEFSVLGIVGASRAGQPIALGGSQQRRLLAALLAEAPRPIALDRIIDVMWDDPPPDGARRTVMSYVSRLRGSLGVDRVELVEAGYCGTELGDWGFMPTEPAALRTILEQRGVTMVGAFVPVRFINVTAHASGAEAAVKVAHLLAGAASPDHAPMIILADENGTVATRSP